MPAAPGRVRPSRPRVAVADRQVRLGYSFNELSHHVAAPRMVAARRATKARCGGRGPSLAGGAFVRVTFGLSSAPCGCSRATHRPRPLIALVGQRLPARRVGPRWCSAGVSCGRLAEAAQPLVVAHGARAAGQGLRRYDERWLSVPVEAGAGARFSPLGGRAVPPRGVCDEVAQLDVGGLVADRVVEVVAVVDVERMHVGGRRRLAGPSLGPRVSPAVEGLALSASRCAGRLRPSRK